MNAVEAAVLNNDMLKPLDSFDRDDLGASAWTASHANKQLFSKNKLRAKNNEAFPQNAKLAT